MLRVRLFRRRGAACAARTPPPASHTVAAAAVWRTRLLRTHTHSLVDDAALATWCVCECRPAAAASPARACARRAPALMMSTFLSFCDAERAFIGPDNRADTNIYTDGDDSYRQWPGGGASLARSTASRPSRLAHARRPVAADPSAAPLSAAGCRSPSPPAGAPTLPRSLLPRRSARGTLPPLTPLSPALPVAPRRPL